MLLCVQTLHQHDPNFAGTWRDCHRLQVDSLRDLQGSVSRRCKHPSFGFPFHQPERAYLQSKNTQTRTFPTSAEATISEAPGPDQRCQVAMVDDLGVIGGGGGGGGGGQLSKSKEG